MVVLFSNFILFSKLSGGIKGIKILIPTYRDCLFGIFKVFLNYLEEDILMKSAKNYYIFYALLLLTGIIFSSCAGIKRSRLTVEEDQLMITRRYAGDYIEYRNTDPDDFTGYDIIWIRTTRDSTYGKISALSKTCEFKPGDRLFLRRTYFSPGTISGYWIYRIENDSEVSYRLTDFQHDRKVPVNTWF
jgi:hypothetical protein